MLSNLWCVNLQGKAEAYFQASIKDHINKKKAYPVQRAPALYGVWGRVSVASLTLVCTNINILLKNELLDSNYKTTRTYIFFFQKIQPHTCTILEPRTRAENINIPPANILHDKVAKLKRTHYEARKTDYKSMHNPYPDWTQLISENWKALTSKI